MTLLSYSFIKRTKIKQYEKNFSYIIHSQFGYDHS